MSKAWEVIHDSDDEDGNPTCWATEINHKRYGKYVWISFEDTDMYNVEVSVSKYGMDTLVSCKSLTSAKRWVSMHL